jgi:hypothetical protein
MVLPCCPFVVAATWHVRVGLPVVLAYTSSVLAAMWQPCGSHGNVSGPDIIVLLLASTAMQHLKVGRPAVLA